MSPTTLITSIVLSQSSEEIDGSLGDRRCGVAVPGQLDRDHPAELAQLRQDGRELDLSVAELQVLVDISPHVVDLDVNQVGRRPPDALGDRPGFQALAVLDVEGQPEPVGLSPSRLRSRS